LGLATGHVLTSGLATSDEKTAAQLPHLKWLFSGKGVEVQASSRLFQKLSRIRANLLRCLAAQMTIGAAGGEPAEHPGQIG
jgi:hypothetical protein